MISLILALIFSTAMFLSFWTHFSYVHRTPSVFSGLQPLITAFQYGLDFTSAQLISLYAIALLNPAAADRCLSKVRTRLPQPVCSPARARRGRNLKLHIPLCFPAAQSHVVISAQDDRADSVRKIAAARSCTHRLIISIIISHIIYKFRIYSFLLETTVILSRTSSCHSQDAYDLAAADNFLQ